MHLAGSSSRMGKRCEDAPHSKASQNGNTLRNISRAALWECDAYPHRFGLHYVTLEGHAKQIHKQAGRSQNAILPNRCWAA
jgi:hypothetical protein